MLDFRHLFDSLQGQTSSHHQLGASLTYNLFASSAPLAALLAHVAQITSFPVIHACCLVNAVSSRFGVLHIRRVLLFDKANCYVTQQQRDQVLARPIVQLSHLIPVGGSD